jgi:hypothetical protein
MRDWSAQLLSRKAQASPAKISAIFIGIISAVRGFRQSLGKVGLGPGVGPGLRWVLHVVVRPAGATGQQAHENQSDYGFHQFSLPAFNSTTAAKIQSSFFGLKAALSTLFF